MDSSSRGRSEDAARLTTVSVPLSPEMQDAMATAMQAQARFDAEMDRLLTPEARRRLADAELEVTRWALYGDGTPGA